LTSISDSESDSTDGEEGSKSNALPEAKAGSNSLLGFYSAGALLLTILGCLQYCLNPLAIVGDTAMYLQCGQFLKEGLLPYVDFQDLNPPLIMYLSLLPAMLAPALGPFAAALSPAVSAQGILPGFQLALSGALFTGAYCLLSLALCYGVLRKLNGAGLDTTLLTPPTLLAPVLVNALAGLDYGQREHLYCLFLLPFVLLRYGRFQCREQGLSQWKAGALEGCVGFLMGLMLCFKPHFLLPPFLLELYWLARYRKPALLFCRETLTALLPMVLYGLHFLFLPAAVREIYFHYMAPLIVRGYAAFNIVRDTVVNLIWRFALGAYFLALPCLLLLPRRLGLRAPLAILLSACLANIELQQKFWNYHALPLYLFECFIFVAVLAVWLAKLPKVKPRLKALALLLAVLLFQSLNHFFTDSVEAHWLRPWETVLAKTARPGDRALLLDTSDTPWFKTALKFSLAPGSRYLWLFACPMLEYQIRTARSETEKTRAQAQLAELFSNTRADIVRMKPRFILVRRREAFGMGDVDFLEYLKNHGLAGELAACRVLQDSGDFILLEREASR